MNWPTVALQEVCAITMGQAPSGDSYNTSGNGLPLIAGAGDFKDEKLSPVKFTSSPSKRTQADDIVLSIRASIGAKVWADGEYCLGRGVAGLRANKGLDRNFLWHWLSHSEKNLASRGKGATFLQVNRNDIAGMEIPVPPLVEQRRIAAILDRSARLLSAATRYSQLTSVFARQGFTEFFGSPSSWADRWPMAKIGDIASSTQYGTSEKASNSGPTPVLRMGNLTVDGRLELSDLKYMTLAEKDRAKHTIRQGDILFNRTNSPDLVGKTAVVRTDDEYAYAGYLIRVRVSEDADPEFVAGYLNSEYGKIFLRSMCKSIVGQANINAKELRNIPIAIPPRALQSKFAEFVAKVEEERARIDERGQVLKSLHASLQSRAFRGDL